MARSVVITVQLDAELNERLGALSASTKRGKSTLAAEAIAAYLDLNAWQIAEIQQGLKEADAGDVLTDEEKAAAYKRWTS